MSKAIIMRSGQAKFLVETDESVEVPAQVQIVVTPPPEGVPEGMQPVVDLGKAERQFTEVKDLIVVCCNSLFEAIADIPQPETVNVEFGIKLAGEAGVPLLTKASGEASFKVSITWKKKDAKG